MLPRIKFQLQEVLLVNVEDFLQGGMTVNEVVSVLSEVSGVQGINWCDSEQIWLILDSNTDATFLEEDVRKSLNDYLLNSLYTEKIENLEREVTKLKHMQNTEKKLKK